MTTRLEDLKRDAARVGLHVATYSPGDGVTRYRFFRAPSDYFGPDNGIFTALGAADAETFVAGYALGTEHKRGDAA